MSEIKKELVLIPKSENYIQHMLEVIMKLPRAEKFNIGNEYKLSMYVLNCSCLAMVGVREESKINQFAKI